MRSIFIISCAALALAACGRDDAADEANVVAADNLVVADNGMMNADANLAVDPATQNAIEQDLTSNDADTNLANGL